MQRFKGNTDSLKNLVVEALSTQQVAFYDLQWRLLQLVESMIKEVSEADYLRLISQCPSEEWREGLINRYKNWKATVGAEEDNLSNPDPTSSF